MPTIYYTSDFQKLARASGLAARSQPRPGRRHREGLLVRVEDLVAAINPGDNRACALPAIDATFTMRP
jgi:hypothetical protein